MTVKKTKGKGLTNMNKTINAVLIPEKYTNRAEWQRIINADVSGYWFTPETMRLFGCRLAFNTLTQVNGVYYFISSENNFNGTKRGYTIRAWYETKGVDTISEFLEFETLTAAKHALKNYLNELKGN